MPEHWDIFISYNRLDRWQVGRLAKALRKRGLRVFKDDWYLQPGEYWPRALEEKLFASRAVAVVVGRNGLGAWQQREAVAALDRYCQQSKAGNPAPPVIPVLLEQGCERQGPPSGIGPTLRACEVARRTRKWPARPLEEETLPWTCTPRPPFRRTRSSTR
jgi:TIR domain